ncbi:MAG: energy transducer TonB [Cyclobacteriaceae bacterium]
MEANATVIRHWEDVVFENRNKNYGAYLLRKAYAQRLMTGLGITVGLVSVLLSMQNFRQKKQITKEVPIPIGTTFDPLPPPFIKPPPPRNQLRHPQVRSKNTQVLVTTEQVEDAELEAITEFFSDQGDTGGAGPIEGSGAVPIELPVRVTVPDVVDHAEIMPAYDGGMEAMMKFIQKKIRYPRTAVRQEIEGTVFVRFIVRGDGSVTDVQVLRGIHPDCDREAVRVISLLPSWKGGSHNGRPVSVRMVLPIKYNLHK